MLKLLNLTLVLFLVLVIALTILVKVGPSLAKGRLEKELSAQIKGKTKIASLQIVRLWPLTVQLRGIRIENPQFTSRISSLQVGVVYAGKRWAVDVEVQEPQFRAKIDPTANGKPPVATVQSADQDAHVNPSTRFPKAIIDLNFRLTNGRVVWTDDAKMFMEQLQISLSKRDIFNFTQPAQIQLGGQLHAVFMGLNVRWPFEIKVPDLLTDGRSLKTAGAMLVIGGVKAQFSGESNLEGAHSWQVALQVPKLEDLPQQPSLLPGANFRGQLEGSGRIAYKAGVLKATGNGLLKNFSADLKVNQESLELEGPIKGDLTFDFNYDQIFRLSHFDGAFDLSAARLLVKDFITKDYQVPLKVSAKGASPGQAIVLDHLLFEIAQVKGQLKGQVTPEGSFPAHLALEIAPTSLAGLEKVLLPLRSSPLRGQLEMKAQFVGPLKEWQQAKILLQTARLQDFSGQLAWKKEDGSVEFKGPVSGSVSAMGLYDKGVVHSVSASGKLNLNQLAVTLKEFYIKSSAQTLVGDFSLSGAKGANGTDTIKIQKLHVLADWGAVDLTGDVQNPQDPLFDLHLTLANLSLSRLKKAAPFLQKIAPDGQLNADLLLKGAYKTSEPDWFKQNIRVAGSINGDITEYQMSPPAPATGAGGVATPAVSVSEVKTSFLPSGLLTKNLQLKIQAKLRTLKYGPELVVENIATQGFVQQGIFSGQVQVGKVFSGQIKVNPLRVPLLDIDPRITGSTEFSRINIGEAASFAKPDLKDYAKGLVQGQLAFDTLSPSAGGRLRAEPVTLNTVKMGEMLNGLLQKVPGLGQKAVDVAPLQGWAELDFQLQKQTVAIKSLRAVDKSGSELQALGQADLGSLTGDIKGTFFWQNPSFKGCLLEGNRDANGRMTIPVALHGSLLQPKLSLVGDVVGKLAGKALQCEKTKFVERLKTQGSDKLKDEIKGKLKSLFGN